MKKLFALCALIVGFSSATQAGVMVEPYLGYELGTFKDNNPGKMDGTQFGMRLAWTAPIMFWAGLDYTTNVSAKFKPDSGGANSDAKRSTIHAVVGVDFPILVRGWVGYAFKNEMKFSDYDQKLEGNGTKIGVGFTGLPFVSLNLEMIMEEFDKVNGNTATPKVKNNAYVLSVSLPWEF